MADRTEWLSGFAADVERSHPWMEILEFEAPRDIEITCHSTRETWGDGRPILKAMSPNRADPGAVFIEEGAKFKVISTAGRATGQPLIYWLRGSTWFSATGDGWADEILEHCKTEDGEEPRDAWSDYTPGRY